MNNQDNNQWIDVDVEKPQEDFDVIVCEDDDVTISTFRQGFVEGEYWFDIELENGWIVTHWQPLPEPPLTTKGE